MSLSIYGLFLALIILHANHAYGKSVWDDSESDALPPEISCADIEKYYRVYINKNIPYNQIPYSRKQVFDNHLDCIANINEKIHLENNAKIKQQENRDKLLIATEENNCDKIIKLYDSGVDIKSEHYILYTRFLDHRNIACIIKLKKLIGMSEDGPTYYLANIDDFKQPGPLLPVIKYLISIGAKLQDVNGSTPLFGAVRHQDLDAVEYLLNIGVNINGLDTHGRTALFNAINTGNLKITKKLVQAGIDVNVNNKKNGDSALILSTKINFDLFKYLLDHGADLTHRNRNGINAYIEACKVGNSDITDYLEASGLVKYRKPCQMEFYEGGMAIIQLAKNRKLDVVAASLEYGAFVDLRNHINGETALGNAKINNDSEMIKLLLSYGATQ